MYSELTWGTLVYIIAWGRFNLNQNQTLVLKEYKGKTKIFVFFRMWIASEVQVPFLVYPQVYLRTP